MKKLKLSKLFSVFLTLLLIYTSTPATFQAQASTQLDFYNSIVDDFNAEYNTHYKIASQEELNASGLDTSTVYGHILALSEDEFRDELYNAYQNDCAEKANNSEPVNTCYKNTTDNTRADIWQYYFYHGFTNQYTAFHFTRFYVSNHYYYGVLEGYASQLSGQHFPEYAITSIVNTTYYNSSQNVLVEYYAIKYVGVGIVQTVYYPNPPVYSVTFSAAGGDVYGEWNQPVI